MTFLHVQTILGIFYDKFVDSSTLDGSRNTNSYADLFIKIGYLVIWYCSVWSKRNWQVTLMSDNKAR